MTGVCPALTLANIGDAPQMPIRGPGVNNWNTSLFKNFDVKERLHFQFRAEAYNTFNHTQFSTVNTSLTFNASGVNTNAQAGRTGNGDPQAPSYAVSLTPDVLTPRVTDFASKIPVRRTIVFCGLPRLRSRQGG